MNRVCCCLHEEADEESFQDHSNDQSKCQVRNESYNSVLLRQLKASLSGVPPPPILTFPQQTAEDILNGWKNSSLAMILNEKTESNRNILENNYSSFQKAISTKWPEAKHCAYFDINYNLGDLSEKIVDLYEKYRERYVGCETSSFVSANSPNKDYNNKKKDRRKIIGYSPGRRLSHLAKRRSIFSSASLQTANNSKTSALQKKTILVEPKERKNKEVKRALFHTAAEIKDKTDFKGASTSKLKSMQLKHSLWLRKRTPIKGTPQKTPHKQTPKKPTPKKRTPSKNNTPKKLGQTSGGFANSKIFIDKAYQTTVTENGKRLKLDDNAMDGCNRSRNYGNFSELSETQRKKLLWAVSAALKKVGVNYSHKNFREYGRRLYRICKQFWTNKPSNNTLKSGISERMLSLASENVKSVIEEVKRAKTENIELFNQESSSCDIFFSKKEPMQRTKIENSELFDQDSSSCDVFFSKNTSEET